MADTTETAVYKLRVEGQAEIDRLTKSVNDLAKAEDAATASARTASQGLQNQIARMDPLVKANQQYQKALETNLKYREAGKGTEAQLAAQMELAKAQLDKVVQAHNAYQSGLAKTTQATTAHVNATKLQRYEMINLGRQLQDVGVSLFSGQNPLTVLVQQGSQIADISAASGVSIGNMFKQVGASIGSVLTPIRVATGGILGLGAAVAYLAVQWDNTQKAMERSLLGTGARSGTTVGDINQFSRSNSSPGGLSISEARNAGMELAKTGDITISKLKGVGEAIHGYAVLTGKDATEATKDLVSILNSGAKGVDELSKTYDSFNASARDNIQVLSRQTDQTASAQAMIDRMSKTNDEAAKKVGTMSDAWTRFKNIISNIGNLPGPSVQDQVKAKQAELDAAQASAGGMGANRGGYGLLNTGALYGGKAEEIKKLNAELSVLNEKLKLENAREGANGLAALSLSAQKLSESIIPQIPQMEALEAAIVKLREARERGVATPESEAALGAAQNQLQALRESTAESVRYNQQVAQIATQWGNVGQSVALQLQAMQNALPVAQAWTNAGRMKAQQEATYQNLLDKGKSKEEASAVAAKEYQLSKAAAVASAQQLVQSSEDNLVKIRAQGTEMEPVVNASIAYRDAIQSGATAMQANAIYANTLEANLIGAARAADQLAQNEYKAKTAADEAAQAKFGHFGQLANFFSGDTGGSSTLTAEGGDPKVNASLRLLAQTQGTAVQTAINSAYATGGLAAALQAAQNAPNYIGADPTIAANAAKSGYNLNTILGPQTSTVSDKVAAVDQITQILNAQNPNSAASNIQSELAFLRSLPPETAVTQKIIDLTTAINDLTGSTDSLTKSNQDLLSPYYTQDPRTSHIGFRSQGMASGGEFTVPGGYSANDNMLGTIPLASGEIVSVRRPGQDSGSSRPVYITNNISIGAGANVDQFKRTMFQSTQNTVRQIRAAS